ncbi:MAG: hypothetical protein LUD29_00200 [Clostridia bacterium]|nr:hypothetical protein [Clostridia bacterium]
MMEVCDWYEGYLFGSTGIFSPWSVGRYVEEDFTPKIYRAKSTIESVVKEIFKVMTKDISEDILKMSLGKRICMPMDEDGSYANFKCRPENIFSFLLLTGYLTAVKKDDKYALVIPNK